MGILKRFLFVLGMLLCLYPMCRQNMNRLEEQDIIEQYRSGMFSDDILGVLESPAIHVMLPIYEGVTEHVLQKGIGHIERSSPLGGEKGTHCLLAGHRGLPDAELLTRLGEMKEGELFYI